MESRRVKRMPADEQETIIVASIHGVSVSTTNPTAWRAVRRRMTKLGGEVEWVDIAGARDLEIGGSIRFPADAFSLARFGLRASPRKAKP